MNARRIQKQYLRPIGSKNAHDFVACRLRPVAYNSNLLPDHRIHQRRFSYIGTAYQSGKAGIMLRFCHKNSFCSVPLRFNFYA